MLAKKVRIKPNKEQNCNFGNLLVRQDGLIIGHWRSKKKLQEWRKVHIRRFLRKELTVLKQSEEYAWLYDVSNNIAKQAIKDACEAYKRFFKGLADKPRFKSRRKAKLSFTMIMSS